MNDSSKMPKSPQKPCTRYGVCSSPTSKMGNEERFAWQKSQINGEGYELPDLKSTKAISFGLGLRGGMAEQANPDAVKRSTGPGSYEYGHCYDKISEYKQRHANRFSGAVREGPGLKTPSPGPVYDISKQYWNGPEKALKIGFNCDSRPALYQRSLTANADMVCPKLPKGKSITMAARLKSSKKEAAGSGVMYNVHEKVDFRTGPSYSFGKGRGQRFNRIAFLPEIDD